MAIEEMKKKLKEHTSLVSGDWLELSKQLKQGSGVGSGSSSSGLSCLLIIKNKPNMPQDGKFDLILASETTYTPKAAQDTAYWLCNHLKPNTGVGLIAPNDIIFEWVWVGDQMYFRMRASAPMRNFILPATAVLASKTTYTPKAAQDTAYWLCNYLKSHTGVGLIATKRYYFGVGLGACGGSDAFQNACKCANEKFHSTSDGERDCDGERDGERDGDGDCYHGSSMHTNSYRLSIELVQQYNDGKSNI
eukprot:CAMPEP_0194127230 /NCGR_PEP_ID=MMETSP0150-20130528/60412_1 /TAXON_ID=122233 /ORGANISM="Chaetoceros debilis, Strain MM31A-1" /LENGTH=247 /DNA_ID=CAMNT_0038821143 /DNA_START=424 /DNA_END=1168 /DNA_ORIENTATION=+